MTKRIIEKKVNSEFMLYNSETGDISVLNSTAKLIYSLYRQNRSVAEIEAAIRQKFSLNADQDISYDIQACIDELKKNELLH